MRILFVNNYYPPHSIGGYELQCAQVAEYLAAQGNTLRVLTSANPDKNSGNENNKIPRLEVAWELELRYWTDVTDLSYWCREWRDITSFRRHVADFKPDLIVLWNMHKLASGIVLEAQRLAPCLVYQLMDDWAANFRAANGLPQFWAQKARSFWGRALKPFLRAIYHQLLTDDISSWRPRNAALVSPSLGELMKKQGIQFEKIHFFPTTCDPRLFSESPERKPAPRGVRFLWAGRMCEEKGLKTTLDALDRLHQICTEGWQVDFCGPIDEDVRVKILDPRIRIASWREQVRYLGAIPHSQMPQQYQEHDVFLFTSEVHEGLPGTIIESFATGMPVIGTLTGGTNDILRPDENCLTYPMGDADALARAMKQMITQPELRRQLSANTAKTARETFSMDAVFPRLLEFYQDLLKK